MHHTQHLGTPNCTPAHTRLVLQPPTHIQGPIIILERKLSRKMRLPRILRIVLTNLALILIGGPTFVAPAEETGFAGRHLLAAQGLLRRLAAWVPQGMQPSILTRAVQRQDILPLSVFA